MTKLVTGAMVAPPLNLDKLLVSSTKNRISRCGLELEGGWNGSQPTGIRFERDGSVFKHAGDDGRYGRKMYPGVYFGEVNSGIIQPAAIPMFMKKFSPHLVDASCGLHVHMSFKTIGRYQTLTDDSFTPTILHYVTKWAEEEGLPADNPLWSRLRGESEYCQHKHWPDEQIANERKDFDHKRTGHRYTVVNYSWRGAKQRTIEVRLLPMFTSWEVGARGVQRILDITNAALVVLTNRKMCRDSGKLVFRDNDTYSESITDIM